MPVHIRLGGSTFAVVVAFAVVVDCALFVVVKSLHLPPRLPLEAPMFVQLSVQCQSVFGSAAMSGAVQDPCGMAFTPVTASAQTVFCGSRAGLGWIFLSIFTMRASLPSGSFTSAGFILGRSRKDKYFSHHRSGMAAAPSFLHSSNTFCNCAWSQPEK